MKSTILLVDDEEANLELLNGLLKDEYALLSAKNGPKAIALAAQKPDLILLDIMMPGMDGYEVCRRLKAKEETKDIPIIFIASKREMTDEIDGLQLGAADYIAKPITPLEVKARVKAYIALRGKDKPDDQLGGCPTCRKVIQQLEDMVRASDGLLKEAAISAEQKKGLLTIRNHSFHALSLVHLSLQTTALEQGKYTLKNSTVDLLSLLHTLRNQLENEMRNKKLTLKIQLQNQEDVEKNSFMVRGDKLLTYALLANLLERSVAASPSGQVISILMEESGKNAIVRLTDMGCVAADIRERFFDKEVMVAYHSKLITEAQGGRIRMRTDESKGTEIVFSIPRGEGAGQ
ncbi:hybrid sensor histidine kinase/response regulator [Candidatus Magnetaquicoccus inordinatus]|uniref:hybrid sensor histidine kinase/response regulator n=1 Tax=Candidatus Magnetaquicoccus inordinatus TaxID=2496818 RepID=UPI00102D0FFE|nr:response regulator [Candidatus Magnetaquicoccus inordinatus]